MIRNILATGAFAVILAACAPQVTTAGPSVDKAAIATEIRAIETQWNADWVARDADKLAAHYTSDGVLMLADLPVLRGRDALHAVLTAPGGPLSDPAFANTFHSDDVQVSDAGDLAYTVGTFETHATNPQTHRVDVTTGGYVTVYRKQAKGGWLVVADATTPLPVAAPAPPAEQ
jgi:uncharacterized protein (TIGR02246 family)